MPFDGKEFGQRCVMIDKLDRVIDLLATEDRWCKRQLRTNDGRRCLMGALIDVRAESMLAHPILAAARELTGRSYGRVEQFNDHSKTDHTVIAAALKRARENLLLGKVAPVSTITVAHRVRSFYAALARLGA